jgi:hypothetical protein
MVKYQYYGHLNPTTKQGYVQTIPTYDPGATIAAEVADSVNKVADSTIRFQNSLEHYQTLISSKVSYIGLYAVYSPNQWAEYDSSGNLLSPAGRFSSNCILVGDLADKIGSAPAQQAQGSPSNPVTPQQKAAQAWYLQHQGIVP